MQKVVGRQNMLKKYSIYRTNEFWMGLCNFMNAFNGMIFWCELTWNWCLVVLCFFEIYLIRLLFSLPASFIFLIIPISRAWFCTLDICSYTCTKFLLRFSSFSKEGHIMLLVTIIHSAFWPLILKFGKSCESILELSGTFLVFKYSFDDAQNRLPV